MLVASQTVTAELGWAARLGALVLMHSAVVMERHELVHLGAICHLDRMLILK